MSLPARLLRRALTGCLFGTLLAACGSSTASPPALLGSTPGISSSPAGVSSSSRPPSLVPLAVSFAAASVVQSQPPASSCHSSGSGAFVLPDRSCTPGAVNPAVNDATRASTMCLATYGVSVRPRERVLAAEAMGSLAAYGDLANPSAFVYSFLVPLDLGGAVNDTRNLWPEPTAVVAARDHLEFKLRTHVCNGTLSVLAAQDAMALNWVSAYAQYVGPLANLSETPPPNQNVTLGAPCSDVGSVGYEASGTALVCSASGGRTVWGRS